MPLLVPDVARARRLLAESPRVKAVIEFAPSEVPMLDVVVPDVERFLDLALAAGDGVLYLSATRAPDPEAAESAHAHIAMTEAVAKAERAGKAGGPPQAASAIDDEEAALLQSMRRAADLLAGVGFCEFHAAFLRGGVLHRVHVVDEGAASIVAETAVLDAEAALSGLSESGFGVEEGEVAEKGGRGGGSPRGSGKGR